MLDQIYLDCSIENSHFTITSPVKLENFQIIDVGRQKVDCPLIWLRKSEDKQWNYTFDASRLQPWSPENPELYYLETEFGKIRFGFSKLGCCKNTNVIQHNNCPVYLRGYIRGIAAHDHPNMTGKGAREAAVKNILQAKKYGFNLVRFHSTVPTIEFVEAADELGLFVHLEVGFNYTYDDSGEKILSASNDLWLETVRRYRNHPSVVIFCIGNEMHQAGHYSEVGELYEQARSLAPGKLIMDNAGWGEFDRECSDIFAQHVAYFFPFKKHKDMFNSDAPWHLNGSVYDEEIESIKNIPEVNVAARRRLNPVRPVIAHEAVHYIDIPDYKKLNDKFDKFTEHVGEEYLARNGIKKPRYLTELPELIKQKKLEAKMPDYIAGSRQFKMTCLKTYIERLRLSNLSGYEMLQFSDCLKYENKNGIVDFFDDDKGIPVEWLLQFNSAAVLLAEFENEVFYYDQTVKVDISLSNYLSQARGVGDLQIELHKNRESREIYSAKNISVVEGLQKLAELKLEFKSQRKSSAYELRAIFNLNGKQIKNSWKFWLYPRNRNEAAKTGISVIEVFDDKVFDKLGAGEDVLLIYHRDKTQNQYYLPGALERFKPCIWDRGSNLGGIIYSQTLREVLGNGRYFDLNMYSVLEESYKICLDDFPFEVEEHIGGIDKPVRDRMKGLIDGVKNFIPEDTLRNFSHLFSVKVGEGNLLICTLNFHDENDPVSANCLATILNYFDKFKTEKSVSLNELREFVLKQTRKGPSTEDVMNRFWEEDEKLVEDTLFWEESGIDLRYLEEEANTDKIQN